MIEVDGLQTVFFSHQEFKASPRGSLEALFEVLNGQFAVWTRRFPQARVEAMAYCNGTTLQHGRECNFLGLTVVFRRPLEEQRELSGSTNDDKREG